MKVGDLKTPCAAVDTARLQRNAEAMSRRAFELGVALRPHVKTHKCVEIAQLSSRPGHRDAIELTHADSLGPITVSTMAEACHFAAHGFQDITWAQPINPHRIEEAFMLMRQVERFNLLIDSAEVVERLDAFARRADRMYSVFLKVDVGFGRAGVNPDSDEALRLAAQLRRSKWADFRGVLTHAGHAYDCLDRDAIAVVARQERDRIVGFAARLRLAGIEVQEVSLGSTPTVAVVEDLTGVTEVRPGNYLFYDRFQSSIGVCELEDIAFFVLTTVIGCYPERQTLILDAGALALSKDSGATHVDPAFGFGLLASSDGQTLYAGLTLHALFQEHGKVVVSPEFSAADFPVGTQLRVYPNHSCLTAACYSQYYVLRDNLVVGSWATAGGW